MRGASHGERANGMGWPVCRVAELVALGACRGMDTSLSSHLEQEPARLVCCAKELFNEQYREGTEGVHGSC